MSDDRDPMWPPALFAREFQEASEQAIDRQQQYVQRMLGANGMADSVPSQLGAMSQLAMFKTRVQSGGRISIPDAEREALDIEEGDIVQTVVVPIKRDRATSDSDD
ncbi:AbrB/MazE/SpoVT family DNA-binding domain-containing protein [Halomarina salina]|uniref:AbrB/MazE/SpoVT family DNA-binding domain-containing protein n=1 Tax=Halomarina salina TaxID=1872699 RepID=A0ABD5RLE0_9EURY|nr:AbrB/MazE/SpoVT family DNA-binding domain-containing protein [Halomarina salina]